jgi:hypothetical protein
VSPMRLASYWKGRLFPTRLDAAAGPGMLARAADPKL